ncbi:MAG: hypothetical protein ACXABV_12205 [Candidatus Thorarchaeota archaeon]|jgi:hypothetical protein
MEFLLSQYLRAYQDRLVFESRMIEIHLQDCLRELVIGSQQNPESVIVRKSVPGEPLSHLISSLGLDQKELGNCYINGILAKSNDVVEAGDSVELYPISLGLLCGGQLK